MADGLVVHTRVVYNGLSRIKAAMIPMAEAAVAKAAMDIVAQAQTRTPVDTGFLRASITAQQVGPAHWRVTVGAEYGIYVEFGTRFMGAQPFLAPAVDAVRPSFIEAMRRIAA